MKKASLIVVIATISLSGCGTVCNLGGGFVHPDSEPRVYGGFMRDVVILYGARNDSLGIGSDGRIPAGSEKGTAIMMAAIIAVATVDPLLSLVGDTLTLPITIPLQNRRIDREQQAESSTPTPPVPVPLFIYLPGI
jgi:uncharacterized protein YceK